MLLFQCFQKCNPPISGREDGTDSHQRESKKYIKIMCSICRLDKEILLNSKFEQ